MQHIVQCFSWKASDVNRSFVVDGFGRNHQSQSVSIRFTEFTPFFHVLLERDSCSKGGDETEQIHDTATLVSMFRTMVSSNELREELLVQRCSIVQRKPYDHFRIESSHSFLRLVFATKRAFQAYARTISDSSRGKFLFEAHVDPLVSFFHQVGLHMPSAPFEIASMESSMQHSGVPNVPDEKSIVLCRSYTTIRATTQQQLLDDRHSSLAPVDLIFHLNIKTYRSSGVPRAQRTYDSFCEEIVRLACIPNQTPPPSFLFPVHAWVMGALGLITRLKSQLSKPHLALLPMDPVPDEHTIRTFTTFAQAEIQRMWQSKRNDCEEEHRAVARKLKDFLGVLSFPMLRGDPIESIQVIACRRGESCPFFHKTLSRDDNDERMLLGDFAALVKRVSPDILVSFRPFSFDWHYICTRLTELGGSNPFLLMGRTTNAAGTMTRRHLTTCENACFPQVNGILQVDVLHLLRTFYPSIVGDTVAAVAYNVLGGSLFDKSWTNSDKSSLSFFSKLSTSFLYIQPGDRLAVLGRHNKTLVQGTVQSIDTSSETVGAACSLTVQIVINDLSWEEDASECQLFPEDDRVLKWKLLSMNSVPMIVEGLLCTLRLMDLVIAQSNVCSVPIAQILFNGPGLRAESLVLRKCKERGFLLPSPTELVYRPRPAGSVAIQSGTSGGSGSDSFKGGLVLTPSTGVYWDTSVSILDFFSMYPSVIISENLSREQLIRSSDFLGDAGAATLRDHRLVVKEIVIDESSSNDLSISRKRSRHAQQTCRIVQPSPEEEALSGSGGTMGPGSALRGILPSILIELLNKRKCAQELFARTKDPFYDTQQLAFKLTANSLYGCLGQKTSSLYCRTLAACTARVGQTLLLQARNISRNENPGLRVIYGDTDSIMIAWPGIGYDECEKRARVIAESMQQHLSFPHKLKYEKTFDRFLLFGKKNYCGFQTGKEELTVAGNVLRRQDFPVVLKEKVEKLYRCILSPDLQSVNASTWLHMWEIARADLNSLSKSTAKTDQFVLYRRISHETYNSYPLPPHKQLADRCDARGEQHFFPGDAVPCVYVDLTRGGTRSSKTGQQKTAGITFETPAYIDKFGFQIDFNKYREILEKVYIDLFASGLIHFECFGPHLPEYHRMLHETTPENVLSFLNSHCKSLLFP